MREKLVNKLNYTFVLEAIQDRYMTFKNGEKIVLFNTTIYFMVVPFCFSDSQTNINFDSNNQIERD